METIKLEEHIWKNFFDQINDIIKGKITSLEVDSLAIGSQTEASNLPLLGITYDDRQKQINILLERIDHSIQRPQSILIQKYGGALASIQFHQADGTDHILKFSRPVLLPKIT